MVQDLSNTMVYYHCTNYNVSEQLNNDCEQLQLWVYREVK